MNDLQDTIEIMGVKVRIVKEPWIMYGIVDRSGKVTSYNGYWVDRDERLARVYAKHADKEIIGPFFGASPNDADKGYFDALQLRGINFFDTVFGTQRVSGSQRMMRLQ